LLSGATAAAVAETEIPSSIAEPTILLLQMMKFLPLARSLVLRFMNI